jgi:flagellar hook-basal body complex protein FliE
MSMGIAPIRPPDGSPAAVGIQPQNAAAKPAGPAEAPFTKLVDQLLSYTEGKQVRADQAVMDLAAGRTESVHNVMLAVAEADLSFRLVLEIRNRLSDAYQEIMRMQV